MRDIEGEHLCRIIEETLFNAKKRYEVLDGKDKYALQNELLEWMSSDWDEIEVEWFSQLE